MELLWIFLLLFNGYIANANKEECRQECVVVHIPHIMCAPDVAKVSLMPFCEYTTLPQFRNLLSKESTQGEGELCEIDYCKPKPCKETHKPVDRPKYGSLDTVLILPQTANPKKTPEPKAAIVVNEDSIPVTVPEESIQTDKILSPEVPSATIVDVSKECPIHQPPHKVPPPCDKPPKVNCLPIECQAPFLQNSPTSRFVYPGCDCECYPPIFVNPRYMFELTSLYNQPCRNGPLVSSNQFSFSPEKGGLGQGPASIDTRGLDQINQNAYSSLDLKLSPGDSYQSHLTTVQGINKDSNDHLQYFYNKNPKDHIYIPIGTDKSEVQIPMYFDPDYMYKFCSALPPKTEPKPQHKSKQHPHQHQHNYHQHQHQHQHNQNQHQHHQHQQTQPPYSSVELLHHDKKVKPSPETAPPPTPETNPFESKQFDLDLTQITLGTKEIKSIQDDPTSEIHEHDVILPNSNDGSEDTQEDKTVNTDEVILKTDLSDQKIKDMKNERW